MHNYLNKCTNWVILFDERWLNPFMCNIEKQLETLNKMPAFYKRYVDDTLSTIRDVPTASDFLLTLINIHPSIDFTMELEENDMLRPSEE